MKLNKVEIDIIMGIYNCEEFLEESIESLLNQTFNNWRLIMCDDGSKDNTYNIALKYYKKYKDKIIILKNKKNMGLNYTLNKCIERSTAKYIARMDADDTCDKTRLEKEYNFLEKHKEYALVSTEAALFDDNGVWGKLQLDEKPINKTFVKGSPFCHAAVLIRSDILKSVGGYSVDERLLRVEDYHLWFKLYAKGYKGYNIQEELYNIRDDRNAANRRTWKNRKNEYYVRKLGFKMLNLPWYYKIYAYKPLIIGVIPIYIYIYKKKEEKKTKDINILFVHDGEKIKVDEHGNRYTDGSYSKEVWQRYKRLGENISVIFRKEKKEYNYSEAVKKFQKLDDDIEFLELKNLNESIISFLSLRNRTYNKRIIKENVKKNDIIIARVPSDASYIAIKEAKKLNKKYIIEVVGCPLDTLWNHGIRGKLLAIPSYIKLKKCLRTSKNIIYVTNKFLQKRYPTSGYSIGCSDVVINDVNVNTIERRIQKINNTSNKKIIIGTCAAIDVPYKGQQYVIKAISKLKKLGYNLEYQIVGGGEPDYLLKISKKYNVEQNIVIIGSIPHDKVFEWLESIDIYIQPSNQEGLCRSLIEAMSMGCPCIASNVGGNPELINKEFVFPKKNVKKLLKKIKLLINDKELQKEQAINNFEKSKNYQKEILDDKRNRFYKNVLK